MLIVVGATSYTRLYFLNTTSVAVSVANRLTELYAFSRLYVEDVGGKKRKAFCICKGNPAEEDRFTTQQAHICSNLRAQTIFVKVEEGGV